MPFLSHPYKPDAQVIPSLVCSGMHTALVKVYLYALCVYMLKRKGTCGPVYMYLQAGPRQPSLFAYPAALLMGLLLNLNQVSPAPVGDPSTVGRQEGRGNI